MLLPSLLLFLLSAWFLGIFAQNNGQEDVVRDFFQQANHNDGANGASTHTNNWAVLVCASRYWFNYRHMANALGMYRTVKRLGIPDSNIILMLADDVACNTRNKFGGSVYANPDRMLDLYGENIEVDYRGYEVTVENFIRVLTGRMEPSVPRSKRLLSDDRSNIFVYMTGHGGSEFLKFQDNEEISAFDIANAFEQMYQKKRYNEIFFMIDTCQANTMYSKFYSPNILATGSSELGENSYSHSHSNDYELGVSLIDAYTHYMLEYMEGINKTSHKTMADLFAAYDPDKIKSHPGVRNDLFKRPLSSARITDFFGSVAQVDVTTNPAEHPISTNRDHPASSSPRPQDPEVQVQQVRPGNAPIQDSDTMDFISLNVNVNANEWKWRRLRTWCALGGLGLLVGFASTRTRTRT